MEKLATKKKSCVSEFNILSKDGGKMVVRCEPVEMQIADK